MFILQSDVQAEIEKLRQELEDTISMYERTRDELVHAQNKVFVNHLIELKPYD